jgi:ribose transport system ATP-binding protein
MSPAPDLYAATGVSKSFPGVKALDDVRITVRAGRLNAVLGENGAGKSTLMNILSGVFPPDSGELRLEGRAVSFHNTREAQLAGISIIFQELNLVPHLSIAENIFIGREPAGALGVIDYRRMNREAAALLEQLELDVEPTTPVAKLRVGQQQIVEIAKALSLDAKVLIMDEPTSAITEQEVDVLVRLIARLKARGLGLVYITHKLDELPRVADDITVMRDGRFIAEKPFAETNRDEMVSLMVGRDLSGLCSRTSVEPGPEVLRVRSMSLPHPDRAGDFLVRDVSFSARKGEVVGLFGLMGAGRTELLECLFGLHPRTTTGQVFINGKEMRIRSPRDAIVAGLALAPEDRKQEGLVLGMSVVENTTLASLERTERVGLLQPAAEAELAGSYVDRLRVKTPSLHQIVRNLSGGNQQKVVLAKWLATDPKVLLLDEPTRGIDINAKKEIYALIDELVRTGLAVVMVSSELPEILAMSDRILVLGEGRLNGEFTRETATEESVMRAALPAKRKPAAIS